MAVIETKKLSVGYKDKAVLDGVDLSVNEGEILSLMGGSGCGKSTLLRSVMGLIPISGGEIYIEGRRTDNLSDSKMNEVRIGMGMVFQEGALFDSMTVRENVAFALRRHTKIKEKTIRETVKERLEAVGLDSVEETRRHDLEDRGQTNKEKEACSFSPGLSVISSDLPGVSTSLSESTRDVPLAGSTI